MENNNLTGIERELVLRYLIDGNVPVTVTPVEKEDGSEESVKPLSSAVFPVALQSEQFASGGGDIILLKNPPQSVIGFAGKRVRIEFYFNKVGLFFITEMRAVKSGLAFVAPESICRIKDAETEHDYDFSATIYYSCSNKATVNFDCVPCEGFELFARPVWASIALEN